MALVVTARTAPLAARHRALPLRWLALATTLWSAGAFTFEQVALVLLPTAILDDLLQAERTLTLLLTATLCGAVWLNRRDDALLLFTATLAPLIFAARLLAEQVLVLLDLPTLAEVTSVGLGLVVLGLLTAATVATRMRRRQAARAEVAAVMFRWVLGVTGFVVFTSALSGASVRATGASWACNGQLLCRFGEDALTDLQVYHRLLAYVAAGLVAWVAVEALRSQSRMALAAACALAAATTAQAGLGVSSALLGVSPLAQAAHSIGSTAMWMATVALAVVAYRTEARTLPRHVPWNAYVQLTKPRVMSLLLATTAAAMFIAAHGMPPLRVFIATLVGGALMSGGAGAINHYVDRDIDPLMGRTAWRPIPSGVIAPARALWFGIALAVLASAVLLIFVNVLATVFALLGLLGYVFIYTLWLKRSTPSNIVIGGAAGALPPLVGWAAVTNEVSSLTAWYLFAIIFFWTPPHFWALSLLIRKHYERAGVPMLPVVRGEEETRRQIVLYSLLLVALTLVLSPFRLMGLFYFGTAIVLGGLFILNAVHLWRAASPAAARRLYLFSILYLFVLFAAMAIDRSL